MPGRTIDVGVKGNRPDAFHGVVGCGVIQAEGPLPGISMKNIQITLPTEGACDQILSVRRHIGIVYA